MSGTPNPTVARFGSGRAIQRVEDDALLRGQGRFTDDRKPPGLLHVAFVRSTEARARIVSIDTAEAAAMPGVVAIYTGASLAAAGVQPLPPAHSFHRPDGQPIDPPRRAPLAVGAVNFVGEAIAAVIGETKAAARDAADAVIAQLESLPAVADPLAAMQPDAPALWPGAPGNVVGELRHGDAAATTEAFARAAHVVELDLVNQRLAPSPLEPRSVQAEVEDGRLVVRISNQMPTAVRTEIAHCLPGLKAEDVRVLVGDVGGGFGMKTGPNAEDLVVAWAAWQLKRPVRWVADRVEDFLTAYHGRDLISHAALALDAEGRVLGLRLRSIGNVGAYPTYPGVLIALRLGPWVTTGVYDVPVIDFHQSAVLTNTAPIGPYRGAGRPEAVYIMERLMSAAAHRLGLDAAELRRRNMIRPEQMPYRNAMDQVYDSGRFERMLDQGLELADWRGFEARRAKSKAQGRLRGRGIATFLEWTGGPLVDEKVEVRIVADRPGEPGFIELTTPLMAMGQGIVTSYVQLAVDTFGVPVDRVRVVQGDTDRANGFGSAASRSLFTGGAAVQVASQRAVEVARELAAEALEVGARDLSYAEGRFSVAGTDVSIGLFDLAGRQPQALIAAEGSAKADAPSWPNGCHVAEVEVDPDTGAVQVVAYASVNDIGRVISPEIVRGQVDGGAVQGIGQALWEAVVHDAEGQLLNASFMDYAMPRADGAPAFLTKFDESVPCLTNRLGAKGVGELGTIGATPAVVNAVIDALGSVGRRDVAERLQMPLTAERVWRALRGEAAPAPAVPGV